MSNSKYIKVKEAAKIIGVDPRTMKKVLCNIGVIDQGKNNLLINKDKLLEYLDANMVISYK